MDPDQTAPIGAVCSGSMLFASILNFSVMLGNYLQQTTSTDNIFRCIFFLVLQELKATRYHIIIYHNRIFDLRAGAEASSTSMGPFPGNWLAAGIADLTPDLQVLLS